MISVFMASIGFWGSLVYYNAYLPEIADPIDHDKISARGFSLGYFGSSMLLITILVLIMGFGMNARWAFVLVMIWWIGFAQYTLDVLPHNSKPKEAGKISKRGAALGVSLRGSLHELVDKILNDLNYESLNVSQKIKLLDISLKYSLPRLSIEKQITDQEPPREIEISFVGDDGEVIDTHRNILDENFVFKDLLGGNKLK